MYQTVGHDAIHFYAECMDLPLYRREIHGTPIHQEYDYVATDKDETEDLYMLLQDILVRKATGRMQQHRIHRIHRIHSLTIML